MKGFMGLMFDKTLMIMYSDLLVLSFPQPASCTLINDYLHFPKFLLRTCQNHSHNSSLFESKSNNKSSNSKTVVSST